jgi:hypothetical protein
MGGGLDGVGRPEAGDALGVEDDDLGLGVLAELVKLGGRGLVAGVGVDRRVGGAGDSSDDGAELVVADEPRAAGAGVDMEWHGGPFGWTRGMVAPAPDGP